MTFMKSILMASAVIATLSSNVLGYRNVGPVFDAQELEQLQLHETTIPNIIIDEPMPALIFLEQVLLPNEVHNLNYNFPSSHSVGG